ncbi:MAG: AAA family ATPase [Pseudomonadota bacterium]
MNEQSPIEAPATDALQPAWMEEVLSGLSVRAHFLLSGNIRDLHAIACSNTLRFMDTEAAIWSALESRGYGALLVADPVEGLRLHPGCDRRFAQVLEVCGLAPGQMLDRPGALADLAGRVISETRLPIGLMIDHASATLRALGPERDALFVWLDKASREAPESRPDASWGCPPRNPIFWMLERPGDLPSWFTGRNPAVRELALGLPDLATRSAFAHEAVRRLPDHDTLDHTDREKRIEALSLGADGATLAEMHAIVDFAAAEDYGLERVGDALRSFRLGTTRNPWTSQAMRTRLRRAETQLGQRVKGQDNAVSRTLDILVRSIMGLSAAQTSARGNRPRGVLFFVGPTGVGKTELAKAVTEVLFGDETAMHRFDMSEFVSEESIGRLIGAPPGAPGHENGGELINQVRARPFSVFLFDEIEKGHPRILDAFLQILDDGRLTDTRGETGYFSEALIIFTSNVGIVGGDRHTNSGQNILPSDAHEVLEEKLTQAVSNHFRFELKRPELMNRMGRNIVAFEFINPVNGEVIFDALLGRILGAVAEEHGVEVTLTEDARRLLLNRCTYELGDGGRGIGNQLEVNFINPLARLLFRREGVRMVAIEGFETRGREVCLRLAGEPEGDAPSEGKVVQDAHEPASKDLLAERI